MKARALGLIAAAALGLAACGGTNSDEDNANLNAGEATALDDSAPAGTLGENATMMNDITTANDIAIGNDTALMNEGEAAAPLPTGNAGE